MAKKTPSKVTGQKRIQKSKVSVRSPRLTTTSRSKSVKTPRKSSRGVSSDVLKTPKVKKFLSTQGKQGTTQYKKRLQKYLTVFSKTEKTVDAAIKKTVRELDLNRDNRLKQVGMSKGKKGQKGKRLWVDMKTGKRISGKAVQKIVRTSVNYKSVKVLAEKKGVSFEKAEKEFNTRVKKTAEKIRKSEKFKKEISQWKKQGLTKKEINEKIQRVTEGRSRARVIRQINPSPEMKHTVVETSE